jgi:hypothetical protein
MRISRFIALSLLAAAAATAGVVDAAWVRLYDGQTQTQNNQAADICLDTLTNSFYVCGSAELSGSPGEADLALSRYSASGQLRWIKGLGGNNTSSPEDMGHAVAVDSVGNVYVAGVLSNAPPSGFDAAWAKYDSTGTLLWSRVSNWNGDDGAFDIAIGRNGQLYLCGVDNGNGLLSGYMVARINPATGDTLWRRSYILDTNALTRNPLDLHPDFFDDYNFWDNCATALSGTPDGGLAVTGFGSHADRMFEWWTMKFDSLGTRAWAAQYHNPNTVYDDDDVAFALAVARNGDIYGAGFDYYETDANYEGYNFAVVRYNSSGSRQNWRSLNVAAEDGDDYAFSICLDDSTNQNVYVTGTLCYPPPDLEQVCTQKFSQTLTNRWGGAGAIYGGAGDDRGHMVTYVRGRVYTVGKRQFDIAVLGYTPANVTPKDTLWSYTYNLPDNQLDFGACVAVADTNHIYVGGQCSRLGPPPYMSMWVSRLLYARPDMAVSGLLAPTGAYNHLDTVIPQAYIKNYGNAMSRFTSLMNIGLAYSDTVHMDPGPEPGESVLVTFRPWAASPTGLVAVRCTVDAESDTNTPNNFQNETVTVRVIDVGCRVILAPTGTIDSGLPVVPQTRVVNYGFARVTFPVWFRVEQPPAGPSLAGSRQTGETRTARPARPGSPPAPLQVFEDSVWISLNQGESTVVAFDTWTPTVADTYNLVSFSDLYGDVNVHNDTALGVVVVRHPAHDVGVTAMLAPPDTVDSGTIVYPTVVVRNFGEMGETFMMRFAISSLYRYDTTVTLGFHQIDTIVFPFWLAYYLGNYTARCTTALNGDQNPSNDLITRDIVVIPPVGIESPENAFALPREYALSAAQPNPFAAITRLRFALPQRSQTALRVYDATGTVIRTLVSADLAPGYYDLSWDGRDDKGRPTGPGAYFASLESGAYRRIAKLIKTD